MLPPTPATKNVFEGSGVTVTAMEFEVLALNLASPA
jgi:hypothetical protein